MFWGACTPMATNVRAPPLLHFEQHQANLIIPGWEGYSVWEVQPITFGWGGGSQHDNWGWTGPFHPAPGAPGVL